MAEAADAGVEVVAGLGQRRWGQARRQRDHAVLDVLVFADQHNERLARLELHELDVLQLAHLLVGQHHAGTGRKAGNHLAGFGEHLLQLLLALDADLRLDGPPLVLGQIADLEQAVDEQPQPGFGRQPSRGRVRRIDQAQGLQVRHDVAHRSGRERHGQMPRQIARADGIARREIALDDLPEDGAGAFVEFLEIGKGGHAGLAGRFV